MRQTEISFDSERLGIDFNLADGAKLQLVREFFCQTESDRLFAMLYANLHWQEEDILIFGKWIRVPRLICWYGDSDAYYQYSGVNHKPLSWTKELQDIRKKVELKCQWSFNSVLANLYRDGKDSMGCHADDEKELGNNPIIASLSFGEERIFKMHHKQSKKTVSIKLSHGDLLVMSGTCQRYWMHSLPKTKMHKAPRINLTFRKILTV